MAGAVKPSGAIEFVGGGPWDGKREPMGSTREWRVPTMDGDRLMRPMGAESVAAITPPQRYHVYRRAIMGWTTVDGMPVAREEEVMVYMGVEG